MGYVVVVFAIINSLALVYATVILLNLKLDLMESVETAIQDEIRKQDDRIEKRLAKREGTAEEPQGPPVDGRMQVGVPYRRG